MGCEYDFLPKSTEWKGVEKVTLQKNSGELGQPGGHGQHHHETDCRYFLMWCDENSTLLLWSSSPIPQPSLIMGEKNRQIPVEEFVKYLTNIPQSCQL